KIFWNEKQLLGPRFNIVPGEPFIKYLAQDFDLMPPLSVEKNVGKHLSNMYPVKKQRRIKELLQVVEMEELVKVRAGDLSGGQMQRVALARALANEPELLLLDEPFSHIDHFRKNNLRRRLFSYLKEKNITCIIATHDSTDAMSFANYTLVMKDGMIHASGPPQQLYDLPPDKYVGALFGDINEVKVKDILPTEKSRKKLLLYPHEIKVSKTSEVKAMIIQSYFKGNVWLLEADLNGNKIFLEHPENIEAGKIISIDIDTNLVEKRKKS